MAADAQYRVLLRSHTRSARAFPAVTVAVIALLLTLGVATLLVWSLIDPPVGTAVRDRVDEAAGRVQPWLQITVGVVLVLLAIGFVVLALTPGRRHRRVRITERAALVVDDAVIAGGVADIVARDCGLDRRQVSAVVSRRNVTVRVVPTSGVEVDRDAATRVASDLLERLGFPARVDVSVEKKGVVA